MKRLLLVGALMCASVSAFAAEGGFRAEATLASAATKKEATISGAKWTCENDRCTGVGDRRTLDSFLKECRKVAKEFGELTSYASRGRTMSKSQLASCNKAVGAAE